jgi:hypothetical protein
VGSSTREKNEKRIQNFDKKTLNDIEQLEYLAVDGSRTNSRKRHVH